MPSADPAVMGDRQHLTDYLAAVGAPDDEASVIAVVTERAAIAFRAEVAVALVDGELRGSVGSGAAIPVGLRAGTTRHGDLHVAAVPLAPAGSASLGPDPADLLVVARVSSALDDAEQHALETMAGAFGLALRGARRLAAERALRETRESEAAEWRRLLEAMRLRERMLETLLDVQQAIVRRRPLPEVLDAITRGAAHLLDDSAVALVLASGAGLAPTATHGRLPTGSTAQVTAEAAESIAGDQAVVRTMPDATLVAVPIHVRDEVAGSLVAELADSEEAVRADRVDLLTAFARQAGLALTEAHEAGTVDDAYRDQLTGLPNRTLFVQRLSQSVREASTAGHHTSVLFIDLDRFKAVNDTLGHKSGDELLTMVAERIVGCVRSTDITGRIGGDEFAVVLDHASADDAYPVAERLIAAIKWPFRLAGRDVFIDASIGLASVRGGTENPSELLGNADVAMDHAKHAGPGRVVVFEPRMHTEIVERLSLHADLQYAIPRGELSLVYQPLVDLTTGRPVSVEALLRWRHPTRGPVPPSEFIPVAEDTGLIVDIGRWVLRRSLTELVSLRRSYPGLEMNLNVSGLQLADQSLIGDVSTALLETFLPPDAVTLELTESALMQDPEEAEHRLRGLRALGVRLAVDDFGTGYSSLSYLRRLPIDEVKIDRTFIDDTSRVAQGPAIVRAIVELGRTLELRTVAEGIETPTQLAMLRDIGCDVGQGYLFARPMDPGSLRDHLDSTATYAVSTTPASPV